MDVKEFSDTTDLPLRDGWTVVNVGHLHVIPQLGPDHTVTSKCWCEPVLDYVSEETGRKVWLHKQIQ